MSRSPFYRPSKPRLSPTETIQRVEKELGELLADVQLVEAYYAGRPAPSQAKQEEKGRIIKQLGSFKLKIGAIRQTSRGFNKIY
jgi:hypothetical protein